MEHLFGYVPGSHISGAISMARAFIGSMECQVHVDKDLGDTWAISVYPPSSKAAPAAPLVVKLQGNDRDMATKGALEILQKAGKIDRFEL
jgi:hypothetical protein